LGTLGSCVKVKWQQFIYLIDIMTYQIDRLFGSKTRVALLTKLLMNAEKNYYLRELSKELNIPYSMLYKEKNTLLSLGVINVERRGKINLISINKKLSYYSELKGLVMKTTGVVGVIKKILENTVGIKFALIYGSFASGRETESSDVDLLIIGDADEQKILDAVNDAEGTIGREVNHILWSEKEFNNRILERHHLLINIGRKKS